MSNQDLQKFTQNISQKHHLQQLLEKCSIFYQLSAAIARVLVNPFNFSLSKPFCFIKVCSSSSASFINSSIRVS